MVLKGEPSFPSPKKWHLGHRSNNSNNPIRMSFSCLILMKKNERLMLSPAVLSLKETDMNSSSIYEATFKFLSL